MSDHEARILAHRDRKNREHAAPDVVPEIVATLTETPDYYSEQYHYERYPAAVDTGRGYPEAGTFNVWSRDVERPNPTHVTWSPETAVLVAKEYQGAAWQAEQAEKRSRPAVQRGDLVRLGDLVVEVPKRAGTYTDGVACAVVGAYVFVAT